MKTALRKLPHKASMLNADTGVQVTRLNTLRRPYVAINRSLHPVASFELHRRFTLVQGDAYAHW